MKFGKTPLVGHGNSGFRASNEAKLARALLRTKHVWEKRIIAKMRRTRNLSRAIKHPRSAWKKEKLLEMTNQPL